MDTCFLILCLVFGQVPLISLPQTATAKPGRLIRIQATTSNPASQVRWLNSDPDNADLIPINAEKAAIFSTPSPGVFRIWAYTAAGDVPSDPALCVITVGTPPPPPPTDPLSAALQAAYTGDALPTKGPKKNLLQALYQVASTDTVNRTDLATVGDLYIALVSARKSLMADSDLLAERQVIEKYLDSKLPTTQTTPLDAATRTLCGTEFAKVTTALGVLK